MSEKRVYCSFCHTASNQHCVECCMVICAALTQRAEQAEAALRKYGQHEKMCDAVLTKQLILPCSCGLSDALAAAKAKEP